MVNRTGRRGPPDRGVTSRSGAVPVSSREEPRATDVRARDGSGTGLVLGVTRTRNHALVPDKGHHGFGRRQFVTRSGWFA